MDLSYKDALTKNDKSVVISDNMHLNKLDENMELVKIVDIINYSNILTDDAEIAHETLQKIIFTLESNIEITEYRPEIIQQIISFQQFNNNQINSDILEIISYLTLQCDEILSEYIRFQFHHFLLNIINFQNCSSMVIQSLEALNEMIAGKYHVCMKIDGLPLFNSALYVLDCIENNPDHFIDIESDDKSGFDTLYQASISLLSTCISYFSIPENLTLIARDYIFSSIQTNDIARIASSLRGLYLISSRQSKVATSMCKSEEFMQYIYSILNAPYYYEICFGLMNNLVIADFDFVQSVIISEVLFKLDSTSFKESDLLNFSKLLYSLFQQCALELKNGCMDDILRVIDSQSTFLIDFSLMCLEYSNFQIKYFTVLMICTLVNFNLLGFIQNIISHNFGIIGHMIDLLESDKYDLVLAIVRALPKIHDQIHIGVQNDFLNYILSTNIEDHLIQAYNNFNSSNEFLIAVNELQHLIPPE